MEKMKRPYVDFVRKCINFASKFIELPRNINVYFDDCPSNRFPTFNNAAECDWKLSESSIIINKQWLTNEDKWNNHKYDIAFFVFHELRHLYQHQQIFRYENNLKFTEDSSTINTWNKGFLNYIVNDGVDTQTANVTQEVEIDANAYAWCLVELLYLNNKSINKGISIPKEAMILADERSSVYFKTKNELRSYYLKSKK